MTAVRVLLIEDDASIRRFVELALEDEPIELHQVDSVAAALHLLRCHGPFRLVITDLMLPDGSGQVMLQAMADEPALRAGARVAVFSAGLSADTRARLGPLGIDDVIAKPASVQQLVDCVRQARAADPATPPQPDPASVAVDRYFAGNQALYATYRDSCRRQFGVDHRSGEAALAAGDLPALRRLAHSLKTVLLTLGHEADAAVARQLEDDACDGRSEAVRDGWTRLGQALDRLAAD